MTIKNTTTAYGRTATALLAAQLTGLKGGDALSPVTVIVRSNFVSVSTRRALAARPGGIANVAFITLRRLAEQLAATHLADAGSRPVSAPLTTAAVRAVLHEAPGIFAPVAGHPSSETALASAHRELRAVPHRHLDAVAGCSDRAADVVRIHWQVRERLSCDWFDEEDLLSVAADRVTAGDVPATGPVVVHLIPEFTSGEAALLRALGVRGDLSVDVGLTGDAETDATITETYRLAGMELPTGRPLDRPRAAAIVSASDPEDEVRAAVRSITGWMHDGIRLGNIAVLYPTADPYLRLVHEQLGAAEIPLSGTPLLRLGEMSYGRTLRALLSLPDRDFRRRDVLGLITGASLLDGDRKAESSSWERISRAAGVVHGDDWSHRLRSWAVTQRKEADKLDGQEARADARRSDADRADALAAFVARLRADLENPTEGQSWAAHVDRLRQLARAYLGGDQRRAAWPENEQRAAHRVDEALDRLAGLDALDGPPPSWAVFQRAFDSELDVTLNRTGRSGAGVLVAPLSVAVGMQFERVVVLGMAEGRFPARRLEDFLLPDVERSAAGGHLPLRAHRVHDDRRDLLAVVAGADHAVLSYPRGDLRRSTERPASRWLLEDAAHLSGVENLDSSALRGFSTQAWLTWIPSFAGGLAAAGTHATDQELRLAAVVTGWADHPVLVDDARVRAALTTVRARRSDAFTRFDGNLAGVADHLVLPDRISATSLESWATCPRDYLFTHVLRVQHVEEPEKRFEIDPLTRGTLVHAILEHFIKDAVDSGHPFDRWSAADHQGLHDIAAEHFDDAERQGITGRAMLWRSERSRIVTELDGLLDADSQRLAEGARPRAIEVEFSDLTLELPGGATVSFRGFIDRIDRLSDDSIEVLDYKTGRSDAYRGLSEDDPHQNGKRLQLFVYGRAAHQRYPDAADVQSRYWFTRSTERCGYPITDGVTEKVLDALDQIVTGITSGVFPARPAEKPAYGWVDCWSCTPDGLSDQDVRRTWERKRTDSALVGYLGLVEPGAADDNG